MIFWEASVGSSGTNQKYCQDVFWVNLTALVGINQPGTLYLEVIKILCKVFEVTVYNVFIVLEIC